MSYYVFRAGLLLCLGLATGCATQYRLTTAKSSNFSGKISLPQGAADRLIVRVNNSKTDWLHLRWSDAKIIGLTGFAVPVTTQPKDPVVAIPPNSSVEYHLFPAHDYRPEGYEKNRRDGFSTLLVYDVDYDRMVGGGSRKQAILELYLPSCRGAASGCAEDGDWKQTYIRGAVTRKNQ